MKRLLEPHVSAPYVELQPNFRLHLPYKIVKNHEQFIESRMGRGKLNPHGQHKDSWRYHPKNTINVWLALTPANKNNGLSILPNSAEYHPKFDVDKQEIAAGVKTYPVQQYISDMAAGDALLFKAELLHGSIINTSEKTRATLSMRCTTTKPNFHKKVVYNYIKISSKKFDNLSFDKLKPIGKFEPASTDCTFALAEEKKTSIKPIEYDENYIKIDIKGEIYSFPRWCSHAGTDLLNGELDDNGHLLCPSHRLCHLGKRCKK
ncbi:phytanoyl-CoA dioxygenase family protein [Colwellia sp. E2M01]|uniref:phytanoyl-CoA dioxygenase family protein n=1 Tax=Colwellia sp. E2M01 TaxID=2841561 RepID=UPI001C09EA93|nr:phytanoyl-CoA dioxygenase family protein [Colwellia sp. E2M01]MBU2870947.1 phytanoyl-CoA dioxygenase family protein [Colwellia sp. E2M01]